MSARTTVVTIGDLISPCSYQLYGLPDQQQLTLHVYAAAASQKCVCVCVCRHGITIMQLKPFFCCYQSTRTIPVKCTYLLM